MRHTHLPLCLNVDTWTGQALDKANVTEFWNSNHRGGRQFLFITPFVFVVVRYTKHKIQHFSLNKWIVLWHCVLSPHCVTIMTILFWSSFIFLNWTFNPLNTLSFCLLTSLVHHHLTFYTIFAESSWFFAVQKNKLGWAEKAKAGPTQSWMDPLLLGSELHACSYAVVSVNDPL